MAVLRMGCVGMQETLFLSLDKLERGGVFLALFNGRALCFRFLFLQTHGGRDGYLQQASERYGAFF